jgi:hypothetical protein
MTVIVLTSGTSWSVPGDWTNTNQVETWGDGASGAGNGPSGSAGGGSGSYSSSSGITGLSGSISIGIGTGGAADVNGGHSGTGTWFNGTSVASSTVSSNGGVASSNSSAGGLGGSTTGTNGTIKTAGSVGGNAGTGGAGGGGAPGPAGSGGIGVNGGASNGGAGGAGDNGSGGAAGAAGTGSPGNGGTGGSNVNGGGGGGGGSGTASANGGDGGLPGAGSGGSGNGGNNSGNGGGGQIRITYTPVAIGITLPYTDLPPTAPFNPVKYQHWLAAPLSGDSLPEIRQQPMDVPPGRYNPAFYQGWQIDGAENIGFQPQPSILPCTDLPATTWRTGRTSYNGWQQGVTPIDVLLPIVSSRHWALPPSSALSQRSRDMTLFQGFTKSPTPGNVVPNIPATHLPLVGVGSFGP